MNKIGCEDLQKLFILLKERKPLWDEADEQFNCDVTNAQLWDDVFAAMGRPGKFNNYLQSTIIWYIH